jgi:hypothetical protein
MPAEVAALEQCAAVPGYDVSSCVTHGMYSHIAHVVKSHFKQSADFEI